MRRAPFLLLLALPAAAVRADVVSDIQGAQATFSAAQSSFDAGVRAFESGNRSSACDYFREAESGFSAAVSQLESASSGADARTYYDVRSLILDARGNARSAGMNAAQACGAEEAAPRTETRYVTVVETRNALTPEMERAHTRAAELYNAMLEQKVTGDALCDHLLQSRDAFRAFIDLVEPRIAAIRGDGELPADFRERQIEKLDIARKDFGERLEVVEGNITATRADCAALRQLQAAEAAEAAKVAAPPPPPPTAPAPDPCGQGRVHLTAKKYAEATQAYEQCAAKSPRESFEYINSRTQLARLYQAAGKQAEFEAAAVELTAPAMAATPHFHHEPPGFVRLGPPVTGLTQAELLYALLQSRGSTKDYASLVPLAERAIKASRDSYDADHAAEAASFALRGYVRSTAGRNKEAMGDLLRAYVRGSEDANVTGFVAQYSAEQRAFIDGLRKRYGEAAPALELGSVPVCRISRSEAACAEAAKGASAALRAIETEEDQAFGPLTWDSP